MVQIQHVGTSADVDGGGAQALAIQAVHPGLVMAEASLARAGSEAGRPTCVGMTEYILATIPSHHVTSLVVRGLARPTKHTKSAAR